MVAKHLEKGKNSTPTHKWSDRKLLIAIQKPSIERSKLGIAALTEGNALAIAALIEHSTLAIGALYDKYKDDVFRFVRSKVFSSSEALAKVEVEDICTDIWLRVINKITIFEDRGGTAQLKSWIFSIAGFVVLEYCKRGAGERVNIPIEDLLTVLEATDDYEFLQNEYSSHLAPPIELMDQMNVVLKNALHKLSYRERQVILAIYFYGSGDRIVRNVAERLGITEGNVRVVHNRAIGKLRKILSKEQGDHYSYIRERGT